MTGDSKKYAGGILRAQVYIQEHLDEELKLEDVAKVACFSQYHFHRIFHAFVGETLNHYIRRLRMEKAAGQLRYTQESITEIALDSGYETPSSFTKAFSKVMGDAPKNYRHEKKCLPLSQKKLDMETPMEPPEIIQLEDQTVLFVRKTGSYESSPKHAWMALIDFAKRKEIDLSKSRHFGLGLDDPNITEEAKLRFDACITAPDNISEDGEVARQVLKGGKYASFTHIGPYEKLGEVYDFIFKEWFPEHQDEVADRPSFCEYFNMELVTQAPEKLITKIYVPLK